MGVPCGCPSLLPAPTTSPVHRACHCSRTTTRERPGRRLRAGSVCRPGRLGGFSRTWAARPSRTPRRSIPSVSSRRRSCGTRQGSLISPKSPTQRTIRWWSSRRSARRSASPSTRWSCCKALVCCRRRYRAWGSKSTCGGLRSKRSMCSTGMAFLSQAERTSVRARAMGWPSQILERYAPERRTGSRR